MKTFIMMLMVAGATTVAYSQTTSQQMRVWSGGAYTTYDVTNVDSVTFETVADDGPSNPSVDTEKNLIMFDIANKSQQTRVRMRSAMKAMAPGSVDFKNMDFVVGGWKQIDTYDSYTTVFRDYNLKYKQEGDISFAGSGSWDYLNLTNKLWNNVQTAKYWDNTSRCHRFASYTLGDGGATATSMNMDKCSTELYSITGDEESLDKCFITPMVTATQDNYGEKVILRPAPLTSKIRVGVYETIPGYSVIDFKVYANASSTTASDEGFLYTGSSYLYVLSDNDGIPSAGTYSVAYPDYKDPVLSFSPSRTKKSISLGTMNYSSTQQTYNCLGTNVSQASFFKGTDGNGYTTVLPNENDVTLKLKVDYTLLATDGSGEQISVKGAQAEIPSTYTQWEPGRMYTYLFKVTTGLSSLNDESVLLDGIVIENYSGNSEVITR